MNTPTDCRGGFWQGKGARYSYHLLRMALASVFFWSGISKLLAPDVFAATIAAYGLLPEALIPASAWSLILVELLAATGLLWQKRWATILTLMLLLLFMAVLGYGIYLGLDIDCGCFGPQDPEATAFHDLRGTLLRDLCFTAATGYLLAWHFYNGPHDSCPDMAGHNG